MKKNLISIIILALLIVNIVLTAVMMLSVTGASKKTAALVDNIATALNLELTAQTDSGEREVVPIENTATYSISEKMTIPLKDSVDEEGNRTSHFCMASISFSINMKNDGYKKFSEDLSPQEERIKDMINTVFAQYTLEEAKGNEETLKAEILEGVQKIYDSDFIFDVGFGSILYQ
ncbi:MAG: flagellar basal body-associated FliL family protein [Lachnospiraceae bacterium]|nr:flagellar basal body-associated FliL family protein [Lachnospiraceae bacterium]